MEFVSPRGGNVPLDGTDSADASLMRWLSDETLRRELRNTLVPEFVAGNDYDAIYFAGGHGTMFDFPNHEVLGTITRSIYEQGGIVGAVCHGPAGLVGVNLSNGLPLVAGKRVAAFSNEEEDAVGLSAAMPFLLESKLVSLGASHTKAAPFKPHVVVSERLVTGQNPASTHELARKMLALLLPGQV